MSKFINHEKYGYREIYVLGGIAVALEDTILFVLLDKGNPTLTFLGPTHIKVEGYGTLYSENHDETEKLMKQFTIEVYDDIKANLTARIDNLFLYDKARVTSFNFINKVLTYDNTHYTNSYSGWLTDLEAYDYSSVVNNGNIVAAVLNDTTQFTNNRRTTYIIVNDNATVHIEGDTDAVKYNEK